MTTTMTAQQKIAQLAREMATKAPAAKKARTPKACACGCTGMTRGGDWMPGHDAKYLSRMLAEERAKLAAAAAAAATPVDVPAIEPPIGTVTTDADGVVTIEASADVVTEQTDAAAA